MQDEEPVFTDAAGQIFETSRLQKITVWKANFQNKSRPRKAAAVHVKYNSAFPLQVSKQKQRIPVLRGSVVY